jgi:hypothetical protein
MEYFYKFLLAIPTSVFVLISALIAIHSLKQSRVLQIQKNTLEFDGHHVSNKELIKAYGTLTKITENNLSKSSDQYLVSLIEEKKHCDDSKAIRYILNTWERVARGMKHGAYNEDMLYEAFKTLVLRIHSTTKVFRTETQKNYPSSWACFDDMAYRWAKRKAKEDNPRKFF